MPRFIPDITRLFEFSNGMMPSAHTTNGSLDPRALNYETSDLNEITRRQMNEDISAYRYDLDFCKNQLASPNLSPQETRTLQIRVLDCGHNIRHCQHRIQQLDAQAQAIKAQRAANAAAAASMNASYKPPQQHRVLAATPGSGPNVKRKRSSSNSDEDSDVDVEPVKTLDGLGTTSVQRLGFWKCRLCTSQKFLDAGTNRVPSAPCKWPLKDVSKILNHYLDMHTEHTPRERLQELGAALGHNRGPFEYWLTRTRAQDLNDPTIIDDFIAELQSGILPEPLRGLNRAASAFPNTVSGIKR